MTPIFSFEHIGHENKSEVLLSLSDTNSKEEKRKVAKKLHWQFGHPTSVKLIQLLKNADISNKELCVITEEITKECEVCLKYQQKKKQIRPVLGFSLATEFNDCVTVDLKQCSYQNKVWLIHIVDHLTQYSTSCAIQSKRKGVIVDRIFKIWIAIFGSPKRFVVDNRGEFNNSECISFCENFNIKTTAAESLVERHNGILGKTVRKMMSCRPNYSLETGVAWTIAAKNSLKNVYRFSPNQLVFGKKLQLP